MKQCSALFDARRPRPRSRVVSIIPERLSASQAAPSMQWREARLEQDDDERLKAAELLWRVAKATDNTVDVDVTVEPPQPLPLTQLGVGTVDPFANCAVARALLRVAQAARPDAGRIRFGTWPDEELDLVAAFVAQFQYRTLPLKRGSLLRTFLSEVLNCEGMRITKKFAGDSSFGKQVFVLPQQNFDLADVAQRLAPLVEAFIQAPQARSRPSSPRAVPAPAPPPPPPLPEGVPQPPANAVQPVAAPAPAAAEEGNAMDVTE